MRTGIWILASCGIVGLGFELALADVAPGQGADDPAVSLTDPIATSPKADAAAEGSAAASKPATTKQDKANSRSGRTGTVVNADQQLFDAPEFDAAVAKKASLIHAEYRTPAGKSERRIVRQVHGLAGEAPFDEPADPTAAASAPATTFGDAASAKPSAKTRKSASAVSEAGLQGPTDGSQTPVVSVRWVKKSPLSVGQECACDLVVKNSGKVAAKEVAVDAFFPATVRLTRSEPMPTDNQDHVTWSLPVLAPGEERTIHITLVPSKRGELSTTALVRFTSQASNVFVVEEPLLNISVHGPKDLLVGDPATQSITVSNPGTGVAHNVTIDATVTKGLEHPHGERMTVQVGSLNPGESRLVRLALVAVGGGDQTIAIRASAAGDLHRELVTRVKVVAPSVKVAVEGPTFRYVGRKAAYVITVTNDGGIPSNNVHVTHVLPEGFRFVRADNGGEFDEPDRTINWFIGRLELKESIQLKVELATTVLGTHVHNVAAVSEQGARSAAKLETLVDGTASPEVEIIAQNNPVEIGVETAYEIHVRNDGSKAAENVTIACETVPAAAVEILRAEGATATAGTEKGLFTFRPVPQLEPGKTAIYRVYVRGRKEGNHRLRVRLSADSIKEPLVYEELTKFYTE